MKTNVKKNKLLKIMFFFIKIITRSLRLGYKLLFLDESTILPQNNSYRILRQKNEQIYYDYEEKKS